MALDPLKVAIWRFNQITPLLELRLDKAERSALIDQISSRPVQWLSGREGTIARSTLYQWLNAYRKNPSIESLLPDSRSAKPKTKVSIKPEWISYALALLEEEPSRSLFILSRRVMAKFDLPKPPPTSSLHRAMSKEPRYAAVRRGMGKKNRTRFVAAQVHQIWHGDAKADFFVTFTNGKKVKVRILSLLDDCSRYILSARIVTSESLKATVETFHHAASRYGLPLSFYADRGSPYDSYLFRQGLAMLGIRRINTKPRNPSAHGKEEAVQKIFERWFVKELPHQPVRDFDHLQLLLDAMIHTLYHQHRHKELKMTPAKAFNSAISKRTVSLPRLHEAFLERHQLVPEKKTGRVRLRGKLFKVPREYLVPRRKLRFAVDLINPEISYLIDNDQKLIKLEPGIRVVHPSKSVSDEPLPAGSLSPLLETYRGRTLPRAVPGFGLPEMYESLTDALGRTIPETEDEAFVIASWLRRYGPFQKKSFTQFLDKVIQHAGKGRPLKIILDELQRLITLPGDQS